MQLQTMLVLDCQLYGVHQSRTGKDTFAAVPLYSICEDEESLTGFLKIDLDVFAAPMCSLKRTVKHSMWKNSRPHPNPGA